MSSQPIKVYPVRPPQNTIKMSVVRLSSEDKIRALPNLKGVRGGRTSDMSDLYHFYARCAAYQNSRQIYCDDIFAYQGMQWDKKTLQAVKARLVKHHWIRTIWGKQPAPGVFAKKFLFIRGLRMPKPPTPPLRGHWGIRYGQKGLKGGIGK